MNDTRVTYAHPLDSVPYGRLLILGNSLKQPSCVLQDKQLVEGAEELASEYQHFETVIAKTCHALAQLLVSATKHSKKAAAIIQEETRGIQKATDLTPEKFNYKKSDFRTDVVYSDRQRLQEEVEDFIIQNTALLSQLKYDPVKLFPDAGKYNEFMELTHTKKFDELTRDQQFLSLLINKLNYNIPTPQQ